MFTETITYEDYNGETRTEKFCFNLTKTEALFMENSLDCGLSEKMKQIVESKNKPELTKLFEKILLSAYGIKSDDGKRFMKSEEISKAFKESPAYDILFMKMFTEEGYMVKFVEGLTANTINNNPGVPKVVS